MFFLLLITYSASGLYHEAFVLNAKVIFHLVGFQTNSAWVVQGCSFNLLYTTLVKDFMLNWNDVIFSKYLSTYCSDLRMLHSKYQRESALLNYLRLMLGPSKERFMAPWVDQHLRLCATEIS
jgi:hypothetical protein